MGLFGEFTSLAVFVSWPIEFWIFFHPRLNYFYVRWQKKVALKKATCKHILFPENPFNQQQAILALEGKSVLWPFRTINFYLAKGNKGKGEKD